MVENQPQRGSSPEEPPTDSNPKQAYGASLQGASAYGAKKKPEGYPQPAALPGPPRMGPGKGRGAGGPKTLQEMFNKMQKQHQIRFGDKAQAAMASRQEAEVSEQLGETQIDTAGHKQSCSPERAQQSLVKPAQKND